MAFKFSSDGQVVIEDKVGTVLSMLLQGLKPTGPLPVNTVDTSGVDRVFDYTKSRKIDRLQCQDIMGKIFEVGHRWFCEPGRPFFPYTPFLVTL